MTAVKEAVEEVAKMYRWFAARGEYSYVDALANAVSVEAVAAAVADAERAARVVRSRAVLCKRGGKEVRCCETAVEGCREKAVCGGREVCCVPCPHVPSREAVEAVLDAVRRGEVSPAEIAALALAGP